MRREWLRDVTTQIAVPDDCADRLLKTFRLRLAETRRTVFFCQLPFYTVPMWPEDLSDDIMDYEYCTCIQCGAAIAGPAHLLLYFNVAHTPHSTKLSMTWAIFLKGICCEPIRLSRQSYYPYILNVHSDLESHIKWAWENYPCPLEDVDIERDFLEYLFSIQLDLCSPLKMDRCSVLTCVSPKIEYSCEKCRRVNFCSKRCAQIHKKCKWFVDFFIK